jgi:hypothetical protein
MPEPVQPLMREFLSWVSCRQRTYVEAMEAWRSACPRQTIWEGALLDGLIEIERGGPQNQLEVVLSPRGKACLEADPAVKAGDTGLG